MFELNWILDEIFVNKSLYESVFEKFNVPKYHVLEYKKKILDDTIQLCISHSKVPLSLNDYQFEICNECAARKYNPQVKGFFPGFIGGVPKYHIFKSLEYFGSGGQAYQRIFITKNLLDSFKEQGVKPNVIPVINSNS